MSAPSRFVPVIVASPLFLQNLDSSVLVTALPSIAQSMQVPTLHLDLAITSYLLSLAIFLPISAWLSDRLGAKRAFCLAIACFSLGSALCAVANSIPTLVLSRVLQGLGGAVMVPVGRLILLRSIPPSEMVAAMVWFTIPPVIGRLLGPVFGGAVVTFTSWRWIFLINIPLGLLAIWLAYALLQESQETPVRSSFDGWGFVQMASGLVLVLLGFEVVSKAMAPPWAAAGLVGAGVAALAWYYRHSLRHHAPIVDLRILRFATLRHNVLGGIPLRIGIGAVPFLLPLLFQLAFGLTPLESGWMMVATALGALGGRVVLTYSIRRLGFKKLILSATVVNALLIIAFSLLSASTPAVLVFGTLLVAGLFNSMFLVTVSTLGYSEIPKPQMSHATALTTMTQQLTYGFAVVLSTILLTGVSWWHGGDGVQLHAADFAPVFLLVGLLCLLSLLSFRHLRGDEGAELR